MITLTDEEIAELPVVTEFVFKEVDADGTERGTYDYCGPRTKRDLKVWIETFFGMTLAAQPHPDCVALGHCTPLDAIWEAYAALAPVTVWLASRGFGGKSTNLGVLSSLLLLDGMDITVLGGSASQSQRVHDVESNLWDAEVIFKSTEGTYARALAPFRKFLRADPKNPTQWQTRMARGNALRALAASSRAARGPHPQRLLLDEADEMDLRVLDAAMGQTMATRHFKAQTVISSTHHYPDGTFTEILARARANNWPVRRWCYKDNLVSNGGWLIDEEVERKRAEVTRDMWETEYELQEPTSEGRAFDSGLVRAMFLSQYTVKDRLNTYYEFEAPQPDGAYATGADWARDRDYTVIITVRYDCTPWKIVAFERVQKRPWPVIIPRFNERVRHYGGVAAHDSTGMGKVIDDYVDVEAYPYDMVGEARKTLWTDLTLGIERGNYVSPKIESLHDDVLYCNRDDLYKPGGHPPDGVVALALAHQCVLGKARVKRGGRVVTPIAW